MALIIEFGTAHPNERNALATLATVFGNQWALLTNIPGYIAGREIDALLVGSRGVIVLELKNHRGSIQAKLSEPWTGISGDDRERKPLYQAENAAKILKRELARFV